MVLYGDAHFDYAFEAFRAKPLLMFSIRIRDDLTRNGFAFNVLHSDDVGVLLGKGDLAWGDDDVLCTGILNQGNQNFAIISRFLGSM